MPSPPVLALPFWEVLTCSLLLLLPLLVLPLLLPPFWLEFLPVAVFVDLEPAADVAALDVDSEPEAAAVVEASEPEAAAPESAAPESAEPEADAVLLLPTAAPLSEAVNYSSDLSKNARK